MRDPRSACFPGVARASPPAITAAGPTLITSVYETRMGRAAMTWSRTAVGLSLSAEIHLPCLSSFCPASSSASSPDSGVDTFSFRFNPWILWKRQGTKRFHVKEKSQQQQYRKVDFAWDLSRACFPTTGGPEPTCGFFVAVAVDGDMFVVVGDVPEEEAYRKINVKKSASCKSSSSFVEGSQGNPILVSRSEHVFLRDCSAGRPYTTTTKMGRKLGEISIDLDGGREKDAKLCIGLDGKRVLQVKHLRWKFRGNERVNTVAAGGGGRIQVSWDLHNWLFDGGSTTNSDDTCQAHAMFVFRFDRNGAEKRRPEKFGSGGGPWGRTFGLGHFENSDRSLSSSSNISCGGGRWRRTKKKHGLLKTSSCSSSASTTSSASRSSVLAWASAEEKDLKEPDDGFVLVVYIRKR